MSASANTIIQDSAPDLTPLVTAVFEAWQRQGIIFVVLRNYEELPRSTGHDIDVLVHPHDLGPAEQLLVEAAHQAGYCLSNCAEFSPVSLFLYHPETLAQAQFDLFQDLTWRGFTLLQTSSVLNWRIERGRFAIPHPIHEAVNNLLGRLIFHGYVKESYKPTIHDTFQAYPQESETVLRRMFGRDMGKRMTAGILNKDWPTVEAQSRALRRQLLWRRLVFSPCESILNILRDWRRFLRRVVRPPGAKIVLLGADGSGKSSVAAQLIDALHGTFYKDKSRHVHWKPTVFFRQRRANRPPTADPHAQPPRGWLASQLALIYHWIEFFVGSLIQHLPVLFRNGMVLIERHHYDFIADPRRYRLQPPCGLICFAFRLLRKPDLVFLLDAPAEVLHARKPEMSLQKTREQREAYRKLVAKLPNGRIVDSNQPISQVVDTILRETLGHLEKRQGRRSRIFRP